MRESNQGWGEGAVLCQTVRDVPGGDPVLERDRDAGVVVHCGPRARLDPGVEVGGGVVAQFAAVHLRRVDLAGLGPGAHEEIRPLDLEQERC